MNSLPEHTLPPDQLVTAWNCLHDGSIEGVLLGDRTFFTVTCLYATDVLGRPDARIVIEVGRVVWIPWDEDGRIPTLSA